MKEYALFQNTRPDDGTLITKVPTAVGQMRYKSYNIAFDVAGSPYWSSVNTSSAGFVVRTWRQVTEWSQVPIPAKEAFKKNENVGNIGHALQPQ